jgi:hypothetical protein
MATVTLMNTGTNSEKTAITNSNGAYEFVNVEIGNYKLTVDVAGFQKTEYQAFDIAARATFRIDIDLKVASQATSVTVEAVAIVQTDASNVSESKGSLELAGYRHAFVGVHQRLHDADDAAGCADRQQQQYEGRRSRSFPAFDHRRRYQLHRIRIFGSAGGNVSRPSTPSKRSKSARGEPFSTG